MRQKFEFDIADGILLAGSLAVITAFVLWIALAFTPPDIYWFYR